MDVWKLLGREADSDLKKQKDDNLLRYMLEDMELAPDLYKPTNFWSCALKSIIADIKEYGISTFRRHESALSFYVPMYSVSFFHKYSRFTKIFNLFLLFPKGKLIKRILTRILDGSAMALADYRVFMAAESDKLPKLKSVSESQFGAPLEQYCFDGKLYSESFLNYLRGLAFLKKLVDTQGIKTVLEVGGGYGTLGEILLKCEDSNFFYIDVDIPPVGYVATRYIEKLFGKENIASYIITRKYTEIDLMKLSEKYRAIVLCPWQLPLVKGRVDLFVNFISFQEMEPEVVANYAKFVNNHVDKYILLRNSRTGKEVAKKPGEIGVFNPVTREHYIKYFNKFEVVGIDSLTFGASSESEVMVFRRRKQ